MTIESNANFIACRAAESVDEKGGSPDEITQAYIDSYKKITTALNQEWNSSLQNAKDESYRKGFEACRDAYEKQWAEGRFSVIPATSPKWWEFWNRQ